MVQEGFAWSQVGCMVPGGVHGLGVCAWFWGVHGASGVHGPRGGAWSQGGCMILGVGGGIPACTEADPAL